MKCIVASAIATLVLVSACTARFEPMEAEIVVPAVKIKTAPDQPFCPPGQAKKGRC